MHYPKIVISDTHLGKRVAAAEYLLEFLTVIARGDITTDELILNGDIIDGWVLSSKKRQPFPETHARVLDALWAIEAKGVKISYVLGNHDEDLRRQKWIKRPFEIKGPDGFPPVRLHFTNAVKYTDGADRRTLVLHGDQFDKEFSKKEAGKIISHAADRGYESLVHGSRALLELARKFNKNAHFSLAAYIKKHVKHAVGVVKAVEDAARSDKISKKFDVLICGHIHYAIIDEFENDLGGKTVYANSGDWMDSNTALLQNKNGDWRIMHWLDERARFGFTDIPTASDANNFEDFRVYTRHFMTTLRGIWPGKGAKKLLKKRDALTSDISAITLKLETKSRSPQKEERDTAKLSALTNKLQYYENALRVV